MSAHINIHQADGVTCFTVVGEVTAEMLLDAISRQWSRSTTPNALWNFLDAGLSNLDAEALSRIAGESRRHASLRGRQAKTAFVADKPAELILLRLYGAISGTVQPNIRFGFFPDLESARAFIAAAP